MSIFNITAMLDKMRSQDADFRCMALIDFQKEVAKSISTGGHFKIEEHAEITLFKEVVKLVLEDSNSEVRNLASGCLGTLAAIAIRPASLTQTFDKLLASSSSEDEEVSDVATLALKTMLLELRPTSPIAGDIVSKVVEGCLKQLESDDAAPTQHTIELLEIVNLTYTRFPEQLIARTNLQQSTTSVLLDLLTSSRAHIRKRAIQGLVIVAETASNGIIKNIRAKLLAALGGASADADDSMKVDDDDESEESVKVAYASLLGAIMRSAIAGKRLVDVLERCVPGVIELTRNDDEQHDEAVEVGMSTLETLVLRTPTEITPFITQITERATILLKYDPNFAADSEDDDEMEDEDDEEDEEDDEFDDQYSDDEDSSWKTRRAAAKLLQALIATRPELLAEFYTMVAPLLISRLGEREESVRMEVFAAWEMLVKQTGVYKSQVKGGSVDAGNGVLAMEAPMGLKRKRTDSMEISSEKSIFTPLDNYLPNLTRAVLKQSLTKSIQTKEKSFALLKAIIEVAEGGLDSQAPTVAASIQKAFAATATAATSSGSTTAVSLTSTVLSFLATYFETHLVAVYGESLPKLVPSIVKATSDKYQRTSIEAFNTVASLARGLRSNASASSTIAPLPTGQAEVIKQLFNATCQVLGGTAADSEVKAKATLALGELLVHEPDAIADQVGEALPLVTARLNTEATQLAALQVIGQIAESPLCKDKIFENWFLTVVDSLPLLFKRSARSIKPVALATLKEVLETLGKKLPAKAGANLILDLKGFLTESDLTNLPNALGVLTIMLKSPSAAVNSAIEDNGIAPLVVDLVKSPAIHGSILEAIQDFFAAYSTLDSDRPVRVVGMIIKAFPVQQPVSSVAVSGEGSAVAYATAAKCIGTVLKHSQANLPGILSQFVKPVQVKKPETNGQLYLSLLVLGEVGRETDLSAYFNVYDNVLQLFSSADEQIKTAAAFAAGNIAVGNTEKYLPLIVKQVATASTPAGRLLFLHALREAIIHCDAAHIETFADTLWEPLLGEDSEGQDDGARNVKAACIGKLTTSRPSKYLPELHTRLNSATGAKRATIAAAIRYVFIDKDERHDELLAPIIADFTKLLDDSDPVGSAYVCNVVVRRLAVSSVNAAAQNKPHLVQDQLPTLLPGLLKETVPRKELIREYQMGPWVVKTDDGINNRKAAYEAIHTLLRTCLSRIDIGEVLNHVIQSLQDVDDVKLLAFMILERLAVVAETSVVSRLDELAGGIEATVNAVPAKDASPQDIQRQEEVQATMIRVIRPLYRLSTPANHPKFDKVVKAIATSEKWGSAFAK
ncbi:hypothetical protein QFC21_003337 [Naganishia friedmannii]|uniref:Uncharacterized protein n=1 Tax=Naganishia friedmannii TaxID=89922 RepID=A0ACC2VPT3_9TREE|nr:hypothetical protein QFC21_003337 [Naganishia friedmannii]